MQINLDELVARTNVVIERRVYRIARMVAEGKLSASDAESAIDAAESDSHRRRVAQVLRNKWPAPYGECVAREPPRISKYTGIGSWILSMQPELREGHDV